MISDENCFIPFTEKKHLHFNMDQMEKVLSTMGLDVRFIDSLNSVFFAGSMFWGNLNAFNEILDMNFQDCDFEDELGQIDGTMAHTLERLFTVFVIRSGYLIRTL